MSAVLGFQLLDTCDVVRVVVGDEDDRRLPLALLQSLIDRCDNGWVHDGSGTAFGFVEDENVVVGEDGDDLDLEAAHVGVPVASRFAGSVTTDGARSAGLLSRLTGR